MGNHHQKMKEEGYAGLAILCVSTPKHQLARKALDVALTPAKRPVGRPTQTWLDTIKKDLEQNNMINLKDKQKTIQTD